MTPTASAQARPDAADARATDADRPFIWIDGKLLPKSEAVVSVFDHGLLYGDGCFEGIRVYQGKIFKCDSHIERIFRNAEDLHMMRQGGDKFGNGGKGFPYSKAEIRSMMEQCIEANGISEGYIRLIFTRGEGTLGLNPFACPKPCVICIADTIRLYPETLYEAGMKVIVAKRPRTPSVCLSPMLKSLNYLNNIMAKVEALSVNSGNEAPEDEVFECIMLRFSESGEKIVGECSGDNLFIVKDGELFTSPIEVGMLDGITRAFMINELIPALDLKVTERPLTLDEVMNADEIFLTGTAAEVIGVRQVGETKISGGEGAITKRLREAFRAVVMGPEIPTD